MGKSMPRANFREAILVPYVAIVGRGVQRGEPGQIVPIDVLVHVPALLRIVEAIIAYSTGGMLWRRASQYISRSTRGPRGEPPRRRNLR